MKQFRFSQSFMLWLSFGSMSLIHTMETVNFQELLTLSSVESPTPHEANCSYANLALRVQRSVELGTPLDGTKVLENCFFSPLITGALYKDPKLVEWLLARGASRNVSTESYKSALHAVLNIPRIHEENPDRLEKLILFYQKKLPHTQEAIIIAQLLGEQPLITAAQDNNILLAKRCLAYGLNPNAQDDRGRTALMCAVENNACDIERALFEYGVDIGITDNSARTAADYAKRNFDSELKKQLTIAPPFTHTRVPLHYQSSTPEDIAYAQEVHQHYLLHSAPTLTPTTSLPTTAAIPKKSSRKKTVKRTTYKDCEDNEEFYPEEELPQEIQSQTGFIRPEFIKSFKKKKLKK